MNLDAHEARQALYCAVAELRARQAGKPPGVQRWLVELVRRLELETAVSASGQPEGNDLSTSNHDDEQIGTTEAAAILGWHERTVRRRATDLGGHKVAGRLVFAASAVLEYREALTDARTSA